MKRPKRVNRRMIAICAGLAALTAVAVPATLQAHPVQNPVILTSPGNHECVYTPWPTLTWEARRHADSYKVKLIRDYPDGSEELIAYPRVYGTYNTSWTTPWLPNNAQFHYGVKASNEYHGEGGYGDGPWSEVRYFYTCY